MQQVIRGRKARLHAQKLREEKIRHILEWQSCRLIQNQWRIRLGK